MQLLLGVISFHFNADFFSVQHFILMRFHLFIFSFMFLVLEDILVKILLHGISEVSLPMFSSRTFMVSQLIFKSLTTLNLFLCMVYVGARVSVFCM